MGNYKYAQAGTNILTLMQLLSVSHCMCWYNKLNAQYYLSIFYTNDIVQSKSTVHEHIIEW